MHMLGAYVTWSAFTNHNACQTVMRNTWHHRNLQQALQAFASSWTLSMSLGQWKRLTCLTAFMMAVAYCAVSSLAPSDVRLLTDTFTAICNDTSSDIINTSLKVFKAEVWRPSLRLHDVMPFLAWSVMQVWHAKMKFVYEKPWCTDSRTEESNLVDFRTAASKIYSSQTLKLESSVSAKSYSQDSEKQLLEIAASKDMLVVKALHPGHIIGSHLLPSSIDWDRSCCSCMILIIEQKGCNLCTPSFFVWQDFLSWPCLSL